MAIDPAYNLTCERRHRTAEPSAIAECSLRRLILFFFQFSQEPGMFQKAAMLVLAIAGVVASLSCGTTASHYVYATIPVANQLAAFREDPNSGVLTELVGSPYSVGDGAHSIVIHPSGKFLYVANPGEGANGENDISLFSINSQGGLTEIFPRAPLGSSASVPQVLVMDPAGAYLYVLNAGSYNISVFAINTGSSGTLGSLTQVPNSPFSIGVPPLNMVVTPSGNFLYVSTVGTPISGELVGYSVTKGQLKLVSETPSDGLNPFGLAVNSSGKYLYAANTSSNSISIFSISSSGGLTPVSGSPINDNNSSPVSMVFDASGNYLYVANEGSSNITAYAISSSTGLPAALTTSTTTNVFGANTDPSFLAVDPNGKYLFLGNQGTPARVQSFSIQSGSLIILTNYAVGNTASWIAVLD
jgi:6-phosphogluconolactonase (cycloisomerase 2 family)